jgi:hypothetical protein
MEAHDRNSALSYPNRYLFRPLNNEMRKHLHYLPEMTRVTEWREVRHPLLPDETAL